MRIKNNAADEAHLVHVDNMRINTVDEFSVSISDTSGLYTIAFTRDELCRMMSMAYPRLDLAGIIAEKYRGE